MTQGTQTGLCDRLKGGVGRELGGRAGREGTWVYLWLILVEVWQKTTKFCNAVILQLKKLKFKAKFGMVKAGIALWTVGCQNDDKEKINVRNSSKKKKKGKWSGLDLCYVTVSFDWKVICCCCCCCCCLCLLLFSTVFTITCLATSLPDTLIWFKHQIACELISVI